MRGERLVQGRCNGEVVCQARTAAVCANGSINHHYSTEPPQDLCRSIHVCVYAYIIVNMYALSAFVYVCMCLQCTYLCTVCNVSVSLCNDTHRAAPVSGAQRAR